MCVNAYNVNSLSDCDLQKVLRESADESNTSHFIPSYLKLPGPVQCESIGSAINIKSLRPRFTIYNLHGQSTGS